MFSCNFLLNNQPKSLFHRQSNTPLDNFSPLKLSNLPTKRNFIMNIDSFNH